MKLQPTSFIALILTIRQMKNSPLKALAITFLVLQTYVSAGQKILLKARGELLLSAGYNLPMGPKDVGGESTLLANMKSGPSVEASFVFGLSSRLGIAAWVGRYSFTDWNAGNNSLYQGTSMTFSSGGGRIAYRLPVTGQRNKLDFVVSLSPGVSNVNIETTSESEINGGLASVPLTVQSMRFTLGTHAGFNYNVTNSYGLAVRAGYQFTSADSEIFPDKNFSFLNVSIGAYFRLLKDKRYKYSRL